MIWQTLLDPAISGRLCMTLLHSLWQVALLATTARTIEWFWTRRTAERSYALFVAAIFMALAAMPITYAIVNVEPATAVTEKGIVDSAVIASVNPIDKDTAVHPLAEIAQTSAKVNLAAPDVPERESDKSSRLSTSVNWERFVPWIAGFYALGVLAMLLRLAAGIFRAHQLGARAEVVRDGPLVDLLRSLARNWSMRIVPALARTERIVVPKVIGLVRPTILLPASAITGLSIEELEMVLAHELAHVKRYDMWVNLVQRLAEAALFFNPALWYLSRRISALREFCCDELTCSAIAASRPNPRASYACALVRVVELSQRVPDVSNLAALAASGRSPSELRRRVARLFGEPLREPLRLSRGGLLTIAILAAFAVFGPLNWKSSAENTRQADEKGAAKQFDLHVVGPDGKPLPEATVEFRADPAPTIERVKRGTPISAKKYTTIIKTDASGKVSVEIPTQPKFFIVKIDEAGYGPYWAEWNSGDHPEAIPSKFIAELDAAWSIGGVVVDDNGRPVKGATIHPNVKYKKRPGDFEDLGGGKQVTTAADGKWSFHSVPSTAAEVFVEISHPEYMPERRSLTRSEFGLKEGGEPVSQIPLKRGVTITGAVTDESGNPIAGALIRTKFLNDIREATSDNDGTYQLIGCEPRMARIVVSAKGRALELKEVRVEPEMQPVDFALKPGGHIRVLALDEQGNPIPKTRIFFQYWRGHIDYFEFDHISDYADENGVWEWNEAPLDEIKADICRPDGMQLVEQSLIARDEEYVFRPPGALVVTGTVVDADTKEPIKSFRVIPGIRSRGGPPLQWFRNESYDATEGQYSIRQNREYPAHLVRIEADGYQAAVSRDIKSDEGNITIDFKLKRGKNVAAMVLAPDGSAAAGAKIALGVAGSQIGVENGDIDDGSTYHASRIDADDTGRFNFPPQDTNFQLVVTHPTGYAYIKSTPDSAPSTIRLEAWAKVDGVFRVGTKPLPNVTLDLNSNAIQSYGQDVPHIFTSYKATTGPDGKFAFDRVFPGDGRIGRRILLMVDDGATEVTSSKMVTVQLAAGETTRIDVGGDGRPVVGKLEPPADFKDKALWNFAIMHVKVDLPPLTTPPVPAAAQNDPKRHQAWWREWQLTDEGRAWQGMNEANERIRKASPYFTVSIDRDGSFRIDDVPGGNYVLRVGFDHQHPGGQLQNYRFSVPPVEENQAAEPIDLGVLKLER